MDRRFQRTNTVADDEQNAQADMEDGSSKPKWTNLSKGTGSKEKVPHSSHSIRSKIFGSSNKKDLMELIQNTLPKGSNQNSVPKIDQVTRFDLSNQQLPPNRALNILIGQKTDSGDTALRNKSTSGLASKKIGSGESKRSIISNAQLSVVSQLTSEQINRIT